MPPDRPILDPFQAVVDGLPPELWFPDEGQIPRKPLSDWVDAVLDEVLPPGELVNKVEAWWQEILTTNREFKDPLLREASFVVPVSEGIFEQIKFYFGPEGNSDLPESIEVKRYSRDALAGEVASKELIRSDTIRFITGLSGNRNIITIEKIEGDYHQTVSIPLE